MSKLRGSVYYDLQLLLINSCLKTHVDQLASALVAARSNGGIQALSVKASATWQLRPIAEPLSLSSETQVSIQDPWLLPHAQVGEYKQEFMQSVQRAADDDVVQAENMALKAQVTTLTQERDQLKLDKQADRELITGLNSRLAERDDAFQKQYKLLQEQDRRAQEQDKMCSAAWAKLDEQDRMLEEIKRKMDERDRQLDERDRQFGSFEQKMAEQDQKLEEIRREIEARIRDGRLVPRTN